VATHPLPFFAAGGVKGWANQDALIYAAVDAA